MEQKQGYTTRTIQRNGATIIVHRPNINEVERKKRAEQIVSGLEHSLHSYLKRG